MAFPISPIEGEIYTNALGTQYRYNATHKTWNIQGNTVLGVTGLQGLTGVRGNTGLRGLTGISGGGTGLSGSTGLRGLTGFFGRTGIQGFTGLALGSTGLQGLTGFLGQTGIQGITGIQGLQGGTGITGDTGATGLQGVDGGNAGKIYYLDPLQSSDIPSYYVALQNPSPYSGTTINSVVTGSADTTVGLFATDSSGIGVYSIPSGIAFRHIHGSVSDTTSLVKFRVDMIKRDGLTEQPLASSYSQNFSGTSPSQIVWNFVDSSAYTTNLSTRIIFGLYASRVSGSDPVTVTSYFDGTSFASYIQTTISAGAVGPQGITGFYGQTGVQGITGIFGVDGQTGVQGITGFYGQTGIQGITGILGVDGQTGVQGQTGQGVQGTTGILGLQGAQGVTGTTVDRAGYFNFSVLSSVGSVATGLMGQAIIAANTRFTSWTVLTDVTSSVNLDVQKTTYATYPISSSLHGSTGLFTQATIKNTGNTNYWGSPTGASGDILKAYLIGTDASASKVTLSVGYSFF